MAELTLDELNALPRSEAVAAFTRCCGSSRWAHAMERRRPFTSPEQLLETGEQIAAQLDAPDWHEAFTHHPRIGERALATSGNAATAAWSRQEQSGMSGAGSNVADALAQGNRQYEEKFGYVFLICASGRSADEMLGELQRRMHNDPDSELQEAIVEHRAITALRLKKLVQS